MLVAHHLVISETDTRYMDRRIGRQYASCFCVNSAVIDPMIDQKFGRIVNITSGSVKSPIPALGLSNGARAALTGFCGGLARQVAQHNVTVNGLLPGQYNTDRIETIIANIAKTENVVYRRRVTGWRKARQSVLVKFMVDLPVLGCAVRILAT